MPTNLLKDLAYFARVIAVNRSQNTYIGHG